MGLFDSNANTSSKDYSDKSNSSAGKDLVDIGVSGKKNTQNVDMSKTDASVEDAYNTNFDGDYAGNSGTLTVTDGGAIDAMENLGIEFVQQTGDIVKSNKDLLSSVMSSFTQQTTQQLQATQHLAEVSATGGQTVVAETSAKIMKYVSISLAVIGVVIYLSKANS